MAVNIVTCFSNGPCIPAQMKLRPYGATVIRLLLFFFLLLLFSFGSLVFGVLASEG